MEGLDLRMEVVSEQSMELVDLFRAEVRDGYGNLVVCSRWSTSPVRAMRAGVELLDQARSDAAYRYARGEAHRLFTPAA